MHREEVGRASVRSLMAGLTLEAERCLRGWGNGSVGKGIAV